jgi:predicted nicotinamide N-methyase
MVTAQDRVAFILANTAVSAPPHCPQIRLHLADEAIGLWQATEEELEQHGLPPPFWAFAWAGGQALARYVLDNPSLVRGKSVIDMASGSGLVGIAAMKAGAASVLAADIDAFAIEAIRLNATLNGVEISPVLNDMIGLDVAADIILVGDLCYEQDLAQRLMVWLQDQHDKGKAIFLGDPGRAYLPKSGLVKLAEYQVAVSRELEDADVKKTCVWTLA